MDNYNYEDIQDMFDLLVDLNITARMQGLLSLEEMIVELVGGVTGGEVNSYDEYFYRSVSGVDRLLAILVMLVVDGTDPELVADIAEKRCRAAKFEGTEALLAEMVVTGVLSVQAGENPRIMKGKLLALLPEEIEDRIIENEIAKRERKESEKQEGPEEQEGPEKQRSGSGLDFLLTSDEIATLLARGGEPSGD